MSETTLPVQPIPDTTVVAAGVTSNTARLIAIDALRGLAIVAMALDHAAASVLVSLQAESYGGITPVLGNWPSWVLGLFTNIASPTFWFLAGVSMSLYAGGKLRKGATNGEITRFFLIRAAVLAVLDLTIAWLAWHGGTPYTHVLLSIGISIAIVALLRLLPTVVVAVVGLLWLLAYQLALPGLVAQFNEAVTYWQALLVYFSYTTFPATEFSILGWGSLIALGCAFGTQVRKPWLRSPVNWLYVGLALFALWAALRVWGGFGDLWHYSSDLPIYYWIIMNKTPPSLSFLAFNLGIAAWVYALMLANQRWLEVRPFAWLVTMGQVALFAFVVHLVIYGLLGRLVIMMPIGMPGVVKAAGVWLLGLAILIPLCTWYRAYRRAHPNTLLRYL
ncbi:MAG: OpgC domain-containing protein [Caldilinea sp.]|nr:OpgC domain-containing protein [Caldilineaceae bacterium]MCW5839796.1 OpgC domain-containing protein [Caldilinea sp.]HPF28029.1 OpgC domain-containing protein [Steroidobacteraceae bacterium]HRW46712.1 OpgC domain-containing protein [Caldilinea sp.]